MVVKGKRRGRPDRGRKRLTPEAIVTSAKSLLRECGKVPSVRKVAEDLGVDPMAIYYYFANKSALLEAVTVSLMESIHEPSEEGDWREELEALCRSYLLLLGKYSGLLATMLAMPAGGPANVFIDRFRRILAPLDLSDEVLRDAVDFLADYLHGFALAMECGGAEGLLTVEMASGPLGFYMRALAAEVDRAADSGIE